jgi:hypothetical protein
MVEKQHHRRSPDSPYAVASYVGFLGRTEFEYEATSLKKDACFNERPSFQLIVDKTPDTFLEDACFPLLRKARSFVESAPRTRAVLSVRRGKAATVASHAGVGEKELQQRRKSITTSLQKLYDERKESISELFEQSWVISDHLEDEI